MNPSLRLRVRLAWHALTSSEFRYGDDRTIHGNMKLDVETDAKGDVVAVWYRCLALPFVQLRVDKRRAAEMRTMNTDHIDIKAVVVETE